MTRLHLQLGGRVQGVGYRWFCLRQAEALGVAGIVRNLADGTVELDAEGTRTRLAQLRDAALAGPASARVELLGEYWSEGDPMYQGFTIRS